MSKFCGNCGTQQPDEASVCSVCGAAFEASTSFDIKLKRKLSKKFKTFLTVVVVFAVGIVGCVGYFVADYFIDMSAINIEVSKYIDGYYLCDIKYSDVVDMVPEPYVDDFKDSYSKENLNNNLNSRSMSLDEQYGDDISVSYEIESFDCVSSEMQDILIMSNGTLFNMIYGEDIDEKIDEMYNVVVEIEIEGDNKESTFYNNLIAVKYDDNWYLFSVTGYYGVHLSPVAYYICGR